MSGFGRRQERRRRSKGCRSQTNEITLTTHGMSGVDDQTMRGIALAQCSWFQNHGFWELSCGRRAQPADNFCNRIIKFSLRLSWWWLLYQCLHLIALGNPVYSFKFAAGQMHERATVNARLNDCQNRACS